MGAFLLLTLSRETESWKSLKVLSYPLGLAAPCCSPLAKMSGMIPYGSFICPLHLKTTVRTCKGWVSSPDLLSHLEWLSKHEKQEGSVSLTGHQDMDLPARKYPPTVPRLARTDDWKHRRKSRSKCFPPFTLLESDQARRILSAWPQHQLQSNFMDLLSMPGFTHCFCSFLCRLLTVVLWKEAACTCLMTSPECTNWERKSSAKQNTVSVCNRGLRQTT